MSAYETITVEIADEIATITLNRPERLNACPPKMADEIFAATAALRNVRAVILTGAGRAFCSGADLAANAEERVIGGDAAYIALSQSFNPMMQALLRLPMPVVSAVNGPAAGIGASIALAADFVIAGESAYFLEAFVNIGLVPDGGASWMLPRLVGKAQATRMMMLGEKIGAAEAERIGLIYKAVADDALMGEAQALAARLAKGPTLALGLMKRTILDGLETDFNSTVQAEAEAQRRAGSSADAAEGTAAFLGKRKPEFKGK